MEIQSLTSFFHTPSDSTLDAQIAALQADEAKNPEDQSVDQEIIAADQLMEKDGQNILNNPADLAQLNALDSKIALACKENPNLPIWAELSTWSEKA